MPDDDLGVPIIHRGPKRRDRDDDQSEFPLTEKVAELTRNETMRRRMLEMTADIIDGRRDMDYGSPHASFSMIAKLWSTAKGIEYSTTDVAVFMALVKIARLMAADGDHDDSWLDLAGYAACGYEVAHISRSQ